MPLNESGLAPDALQMIESTVIRTHHQAAGAKGELRDIRDRPGFIGIYSGLIASLDENPSR